MIRPLRRLHRWVWLVLAALPLLVWLALEARPEPLDPLPAAPWEAAAD